MSGSKNGRICYIEMPATDPGRSAEFYSRVFGWTLRRRSDDAIAFDDTTGHVSGAYIPGRPAQSPGFVLYIQVDDAEAMVEKLKSHGAEIVQPIGGDPGQITARFRDPGGNIVAIYQEPPR